MTDSIKDLLNRKNFEQPDEISQIKEFVKTKFGEEPSIKITPNSVIINVSNASLAGALRMHLFELNQKLKTNKKLLIRIA